MVGKIVFGKLDKQRILILVHHFNFDNSLHVAVCRLAIVLPLSKDLKLDLRCHYRLASATVHMHVA